MKCFYHNDPDGICSAFWVRLNVGVSNLVHPTSFIKMDYSKQFPIDTILPNEQIYIVDFSISPDEMRELLKITKDVIWIDHHKTAIEKYNGFEEDIRGIRYDGIAACMLTYCYIYRMTGGITGEIIPFDIEMTYDAPKFTKLIADWDVWDFKYGDFTRYFVTAFNAYNFTPSSERWNMFFRELKDESGEKELIEQGKIMTIFRDGWATEVCKSKGFALNFEGYDCFAINVPNCNSDYFKSVDNGEYDIFIPFSFDGEKWIYSLYSKTIDVSEIAKKYGGGGHAGASGFISDKLLLKAD